MVVNHHAWSVNWLQKVSVCSCDMKANEFMVAALVASYSDTASSSAPPIAHLSIVVHNSSVAWVSALDVMVGGICLAFLVLMDVDLICLQAHLRHCAAARIVELFFGGSMIALLVREGDMPVIYVRRT